MKMTMSLEFEKLKIKRDDAGELIAVTESGKVLSHVESIVIKQEYGVDSYLSVVITFVSIDDNNMLEGL